MSFPLPWLKILFLLFLVSLGYSLPAEAREVEIHCAFSGGTRGRLVERDRVGGFTRRITLLENLKERARKKGATFFALDSGNTISPFYLSRLNRGKVILEIMKNYHYVAMSPGYFEFAYGPAYYNNLTLGKPPLLAANIYEKNRRVGKVALVREYQGIKVGFFGLTSPTVESKVSTFQFRGLSIKDYVKEAKKAVKVLRKKGCSLIICTAFLSNEEARKLARAAPRINLIIRSYKDSLASQNRQIFDYSQGQKWPLIVAPQKRDQSLGVLRLRLRSDQSGGRLIRAEVTHIPINRKVPPHQETLAKIRQYQESLKTTAGKIILRHPPDRAFPTELNSRGFSQILGAIIRKQLNAEVAILPKNLINNQAAKDLILKDRLTSLDVEKVFTRNSYLIRCALKGGDLLSIYKQGSSKEALVFAGMSEEGGKVLVNGVPLRSGDYYWVATSKYLAGGTTGYGQFQNKKSPQETFSLEDNQALETDKGTPNLSIQESFLSYMDWVLRDLHQGPSPAFLYSQLQDLLNYRPANYLFLFDNFRLTFSQTSVSASDALARAVPDSRAKAKDQFNIKIAGTLIFLRQVPGWLLENKLGFTFAQTKVEGEEANISEDDLFLESESSFLALGYSLTEKIELLPYLNLKYDTEFDREIGTPREKILYFSGGMAGVSPGPITKLKVGALGKGDFTGGKNTVQFGLVGEAVYKDRYFDILNMESNFLIYYFPRQDEAKRGDLDIRIEWNSIVKVPFYREFFLIMEFRLFAFKEVTTSEFGTHLSLSVGITFSTAWKFLYEPFFGGP